MFYDKYIALCELHNEQPYKLVLELGAKSNSIVDQWKKGSVPRQKMLSAIASHFNVSVSYLLDLSEPKMSIKKAPDPKAEGLTAKQIELIELVKQLPDSTCDRLVPLVRELLVRQESQDAQ